MVLELKYLTTQLRLCEIHLTFFPQFLKTAFPQDDFSSILWWIDSGWMLGAQ